MWAQPGKKLLFMGGEFGQRREWTHDGEPRLAPARHGRATPACSAGSRDLNRVYRSEPALHELDFDARRLRVDRCSDAQSSVLAFLRKRARPAARSVLVVCNFTPVPRTNYPSACRAAGLWREVLNSDAHALRRQRHGQPRRRRARRPCRRTAGRTR